jgi:DNA-binding protein HU-beta
MNRRELIRAVAARTAEDARQVEAVLSGVTDVITAQGFAKFAKVERAARMGRNPRTGEQIRIKASKRVRVSPMKAFKDTVMSPGSAPKLERGVWPTSPELLAKQAADRRQVRPAATTAKAAAKSTTAKRTTAKKAAVKKTAVKRAAVKKTAARPAARKTTKKAPAKRAPVRKTTARR